MVLGEQDSRFGARPTQLPKHRVVALVVAVEPPFFVALGLAILPCPTRAYNPAAPAFVRIATWYVHLLANGDIGTGFRILSDFVDSETESRVLSDFSDNGAALPAFSAVVASAPPVAPWLVACGAATCSDREVVDDAVSRLLLGEANDGPGLAG